MATKPATWRECASLVWQLIFVEHLICSSHRFSGVHALSCLLYPTPGRHRLHCIPILQRKAEVWRRQRIKHLCFWWNKGSHSGSRTLHHSSNCCATHRQSVWSRGRSNKEKRNRERERTPVMRAGEAMASRTRRHRERQCRTWLCQASCSPRLRRSWAAKIPL